MLCRKNYLLMLFFSTGLILNSCSEDDDGGTPSLVTPYGHLEVTNHAVVNRVLIINVVYVTNDSWIVIYRDDGGVQGTEILGRELVEAGGHNEIPIQLGEEVNFSVGETLWVALHVDGDEDGEFDWDGATGTDIPIKAGSGNVSKSFEINTGNTLTAEDQAVVDNSITISKVNLEEEGWVFLYSNEDGTTRIGKSRILQAGSHDNVVILLDDSVEVGVGDVVWIRLVTTGGPFGDYYWLIGNDGNPVNDPINITN